MRNRKRRHDSGSEKILGLTFGIPTIPFDLDDSGDLDGTCYERYDEMKLGFDTS